MKRPPIRPVISKKPWKNRFEYWNPTNHGIEKCSGFKFDIYDPISKIRHRPTKHVDYKTAKILYERWIKLATLGEFEQLHIELADGPSTLSKLLAKWETEVSKSTLQRPEPLLPGTIRRMNTAVRAYQAVVCGGAGESVELKLVTLDQIDKFCRIRLADNVTRTTLNSDLRQMQVLFNWGIKRDLITDNPFAKVESFKVAKSKARILTQTELRLLFEICPPGSRYYSLLMFYLITGARREQAAKPYLRWDGINFEEGFIYLAKQKQKERAFPITPELKTLLLHLRENPLVKQTNVKPDDDQYPFPFTGAHISRKIIIPMMRKAGIMDATLHDLRRTCLTMLRNDLGYSTENVKDYIGHSSIRVTENHYLGRDVERQLEMGSVLGKHLAALAKSTNGEPVSKPE